MRSVGLDNTCSRENNTAGSRMRRSPVLTTFMNQYKRFGRTASTTRPASPNWRESHPRSHLPSDGARTRRELGSRHLANRTVESGVTAGRGPAITF